MYNKNKKNTTGRLIVTDMLTGCVLGVVKTEARDADPTLRMKAALEISKKKLRGC